MLSAAGGCELSTTTHVKTTWKKFKALLPVLSSRHLSFKTRGHVYSSCELSTMLHASETWPLTKPNLRRLQRNDRAMIRQICNVRPQDIVTTRSNELLVRLGIDDLDLILKERRLRWYGHVERSSGVIKTASDIQAIWMLPLYLHVNQKSDYVWWYDKKTPYRWEVKQFYRVASLESVSIPLNHYNDILCIKTSQWAHNVETKHINAIPHTERQNLTESGYFATHFP